MLKVSFLVILVFIILSVNVTAIIIKDDVVDKCYLKKDKGIVFKVKRDFQKAFNLFNFEVQQLPSPTNLMWNENGIKGSISWDVVEECNGEYEIIVNKDDIKYYRMKWMGVFPDKNSSRVSIDLSARLLESGNYTFKVSAIGDYLSSISSDFSSESSTYAYNKPENVLAIPTNPKWDDENSTIAVWDYVPNAKGYYIEIYYDDLMIGAEWGRALNINKTDLNSWMDSKGKYTFRVRALSRNIEEIANSEFSEFSLVNNRSEYIINKVDILNKVNINITNNFGASGLLCIASYKDNKLIDLELKQINIVQGQTDVISSNIDVPYGGTVKVFIWNDMNNRQPLSIAMTINDIGIYHFNRVNQFSPVVIVYNFSMIQDSLGNNVIRLKYYLNGSSSNYVDIKEGTLLYSKVQTLKEGDLIRFSKDGNNQMTDLHLLFQIDELKANESYMTIKGQPRFEAVYGMVYAREVGNSSITVYIGDESVEGFITVENLMITDETEFFNSRFRTFELPVTAKYYDIDSTRNTGKILPRTNASGITLVDYEESKEKPTLVFLYIYDNVVRAVFSIRR